MTTLIILLTVLVIAPFVVAVAGFGAIALMAFLGILAMPFLWLISAFNTNKS